MSDLVCGGRTSAELRRVPLQMVQPLGAAAPACEAQLPVRGVCWTCTVLSPKTCAVLLLDLMDRSARSSGAVRSTLSCPDPVILRRGSSACPVLVSPTLRRGITR